MVCLLHHSVLTDGGRGGGGGKVVTIRQTYDLVTFFELV